MPLCHPSLASQTIDFWRDEVVVAERDIPVWKYTPIVYHVARCNKFCDYNTHKIYPRVCSSAVLYVEHSSLARPN